MDKRAYIKEFLDYGGDELFSQLMGENMQRSDGTDRLTELLKIYSDSCRRISGKSAAYRFMQQKARKKGWIQSNRLKSCRLSCDEREKIEKELDSYILSGGRKIRIIKTLLCAVATALILGFITFETVRGFQNLLENLKV